MTPSREMPLEANPQQARRGVRVNSRVPVVIEWDSGAGSASKDQAHTCVVNCYGCLLLTPHELPVEQRLRLTNLANLRSIGAVVVWKGRQRVEGWELGVELIKPEMDFWGLDL